MGRSNCSLRSTRLILAGGKCSWPMRKSSCRRAAFSQALPTQSKLPKRRIRSRARTTRRSARCSATTLHVRSLLVLWVVWNRPIHTPKRLHLRKENVMSQTVMESEAKESTDVPQPPITGGIVRRKNSLLVWGGGAVLILLLVFGVRYLVWSAHHAVTDDA